ncbi:HAD family hydrolase [Bradyrhizobium sp. Pha-3]|uniref:HAD family hydrolase n=1 Tax=Bradyrhizobium sp. Pha-3 TaxID=208375 RepID=UPI0035D44708
MRTFVENQFSSVDLGQFDSLRSVCDRFLELDGRGRVSKREVYAQLVAEMAVSDTTIATAMFNDYEAHSWRFAKAFDGVADLLSWLAESGLKIAIVTNGQAHIQLRSLLALNLDRLADAYLISEQEGCRKPEPEIFLRAAKRLAVQPTDCAFVGDSPESDMFGARALGMKTIWIPNGTLWPDEYDWQPDAIVEGLSEVRELIEVWMKS